MVGKDMQNLCNQISKLSENGDYFVKDKLCREFLIVGNVNNNFHNRNFPSKILSNATTIIMLKYLEF